MSYKSGSIPTSVAAIFFSIVVIAILVILLAWPVMILINWLFAPSFLVAIFGIAHLTFWKTWALMFVCSVLFKGSSSSTK